MLNFLCLPEISFSLDSPLYVSLSSESLKFNLAEEPPRHPPPAQMHPCNCVHVWDILTKRITSLQ